MSFLDHIRDANNWDPAGFVPFAVDARTVGWVRRDRIGRLRDFPRTFHVDADRIEIAPELGDFEGRSAAMDGAVQIMRDDGEFPGWRDELYPVMRSWGDTPLMRVERVAAPWFGIRCWGVHVNGYMRRADGLHMWVARRARGKSTYPGLLDNMVAGGQPIGLGLMENVVKESAEEAAIPADIASRARPVGMISYCHEFEHGMKPDQQFCYDLELPADFTPRNTDGEVESFELWPVERVVETVRNSRDFKFNCNLVIIDFLIRHGLITAENEPDYAALCIGLRKTG